MGYVSPLRFLLQNIAQFGFYSNRVKVIITFDSERPYEIRSYYLKIRISDGANVVIKES